MININFFAGFDPTQVQGSGCCGAYYFDFNTKTWKQRAPTVDEGGDLTADCSQVEARLNEANALIQSLQGQLNAKDNRIAELENQRANTTPPNENSGGGATPIPDVTPPRDGPAHPPTEPTSPVEDTQPVEPIVTDPNFELSLSISGQYPSELRVGQSFHKIIDLRGSGGLPDTYYPFTLTLTEDEALRYNLNDVLGSGRNIKLENGVLTGEVQPGRVRIDLVVVPVEAGHDVPLYSLDAYDGLEYQRNKKGNISSTHDVFIQNIYDIQPETGELGERHPVEIENNG